MESSLPESLSPPNPSFRIRGTWTTSSSSHKNSNKPLSRSISSKEPSFSEFPYTPPRRACPTSPSLSQSLHASPASSPLHHHLHHDPINNNNTASTTSTSTSTTTSTYRCISSVLKKDGQILCMAASSDGLLYTGSESGVLRVWKVPEFFECAPLKTKSAASMVVALQVSNDRAYAAYGDAKIRVWLRSWEGGLKHVRLMTIPRPSSYVRSYIIAGKDKMMKHMGAITSLAINVADDILYSASVDKTVKVWRISDLKCVETIQAHPDPVNAIIVSDDGVLYTASDDATVRVWRRNFCRGEQPHSLTVTLPAKYSPVKALTLTAEGGGGAGILYGGCTDGYIHYWTRSWFSGQLQYGGALQGHTHAVMGLGSAGRYVVSGSADSTCRVWSREQDGHHSCVAVLVGHRGPIRCLTAFSAPRDDPTDDFNNNNECDHYGCTTTTICSGSLDGVVKVWKVTTTLNSPINLCSTQSGCDYFEL